MKNDEGFITDSVDRDDYWSYIDYVEQYQSSFDQGKMILKLNDVFNSESKTFHFKKQNIHEEEELKNSNNNDNSIGNNESMNQNLNNSNIELCNKDSDLSDGLNEIHKNSCLTSLIILIFFVVVSFPKYSSKQKENQNILIFLIIQKSKTKFLNRKIFNH